MRISALIVFLIGSALSVTGAEGSRVREEVARIKNGDVDFQGEYSGIVERISGASAEVRKIGVEAVPFLYEALKEPDRYVAAHVLLTQIVLKKWELSSKDWNHLVIDSFGSASDRTVKDQRLAIDRFWVAQRNLKKEPDQALEPTVPSGRGFAAGTVRQDAIGISLIRLIAAPQEYANKAVRVIGYLKIEFEGNAIYLHEEDFRRSISKNGLWLEASREMMQEMQKLSGGYVLIEGVFGPKNTGHGGLFSGAIININRAQTWRSR